MEQFLDENMYIIDLGDVNTAPEIIFQLSSVLDKEEVKNKRICLKLGNVDLNQAQLLSIKSLINGIDSNLSSVDTKSVETEKVALSLGIIVANISAENTTEVAPAMPYKLAEELREEIHSENEILEKEEIVENYDIVEESETVITNENQEAITDVIAEQEDVQEQNINCVEEKIEEIQVEEDVQEQIIETVETTVPSSEEVQDELDVIFGSSPQTTFFDMEVPQEVYEEREELTDIVVPEQEYTKEDLELEAFPTKYIKQTIRSGQVINYEGNIVIIGDCHPGCEITAFGDITIWGILSGIAHAGAGGNHKARVRALKMNAIQLRIASCYSRRPDSLNTVYIEKTNSYTPEEARVINNEIVVFKMND